MCLKYYVWYYPPRAVKPNGEPETIATSQKKKQEPAPFNNENKEPNREWNRLTT